MGWLNSLLGNGRKFIKRKDSDAGEPGKALEELRSSLYNELRTSEGAKRQQQRYCGPPVALSFNFMVAVGIIMANKLVMGRVGFNFPIFLTFVHYITAWILLAIFKALSVLPVSPPSKTTPFSSIFALGAVMAFASGLANTSLKYNSVGFYQMAKIAVTPTIVLAEFILFRKTISSKKVLALAAVSAGVAVATVSDLEFNLFGAIVAIIWIIPSAINKILWSTLQQQGNWTALALMWKTTPINAGPPVAGTAALRPAWRRRRFSGGPPAIFTAIGGGTPVACGGAPAAGGGGPAAGGCGGGGTPSTSQYSSHYITAWIFLAILNKLFLIHSDERMIYSSKPLWMVGAVT